MFLFGTITLAVIALPMPANCQSRNRLYYSYLETLLLENLEHVVRNVGQSRPNFGTPLIVKEVRNAGKERLSFCTSPCKQMNLGPMRTGENE